MLFITEFFANGREMTQAYPTQPASEVWDACVSKLCCADVDRATSGGTIIYLRFSSS